MTTVSTSLNRSPARRKSDRRRTLAGWLFVIPIMIGILAFQAGPVVVSIFASLTNWSGLSSPTFIGLNNYKTMFTADPQFWHSLAITGIFTIALVIFSIAIGIGLALLCNQQIRGIAIYRAAFFTPVVTNVVAIGFVWFWIFNPQAGLINSALSVFGITGPSWLTGQVTALIAVIIVSVWQGVGYPMIIILAGLQAISSNYREAAMVDGASRWRIFWSITLPLLTPNIFFLVIWQIISSFQVFGLIYVMTKGGPDNATNVLIFNIYQAAFSEGRLGYAAALGWVLFIIIGAFTLLQSKLESRWVFYDD